MLFWHLIGLLGLSYVLGTAAGLIVRSITKVAQGFRVNEFIVSFFIVGVATSTPEIMVSINSGLRGVPELSLGNLLGASIVILSLLIGLAAILSGKLSLNRLLRNDDFFVYLAIVMLPALVILDGQLTRFDGVLLIATYAMFMVRLYGHRNFYDKRMKEGRGSELPVIKVDWKVEGVNLGIGLAMILLASYYLVGSATTVAEMLGISPMIIGLLVLSIGTNLPEFALVITQSYRQGRNIVLGDLLSNVGLNVPTLGLLALISPFAIPAGSGVMVAAGFLVVAVILFGIFMWSKNVLNRVEGAVLFGIYAIYAFQSFAGGSLFG